MLSKTYYYGSLKVCIAILCAGLSCCIKVPSPMPEMTSSTNTHPLIPISTETGEPSATPTIAPTLVIPYSSEEAIRRFEQYITADDNNCLLPCWFGITPGQSTPTEIQTQFDLFSKIISWSDLAYDAGDWSLSSMIIRVPADDYVVEMMVSYLSPKDTTGVPITAIDTRTFIEENGEYKDDIYGVQAYYQLFKPYTVSGILSEYGVPEKIYVVAYLRTDSSTTPGYGDHFNIHLWFPNNGIFMEYKMSVDGVGQDYRICPTKAFILGTFMQTGLGDRYESVLSKLGGKYELLFSSSRYVQTVDEAFNMTAEEFYQIFSTQTDECLETPTARWWP